MRIKIETQPHSLQRYNTVGDWYTDTMGGATMRIFVSQMGNWRYELLVGVHELIEAFLCLHDGIAQESVDAFDKSCVYQQDTEPGDEPNAPYQKQHCLATGVERILAALLGVKWAEYEEALDKLIDEREAQEAKAKEHDNNRT